MLLSEGVALWVEEGVVQVVEAAAEGGETGQARN